MKQNGMASSTSLKCLNKAIKTPPPSSNRLKKKFEFKQSASLDCCYLNEKFQTNDILNEVDYDGDDDDDDGDNDTKKIKFKLESLGHDQSLIDSISRLISKKNVSVAFTSDDLLSDCALEIWKKLSHCKEKLLNFIEFLKQVNLDNFHQVNSQECLTQIDLSNQEKIVFWFEKWKQKQKLRKKSLIEFHQPSTLEGNHLKTLHYHHHENKKNHHDPQNQIVNFMTPGAISHHPGPNENKLLKLLHERSNYVLELSNGQRKFKMLDQDDQDTKKREIFVGRIPRDIFEDELVPLFETIGTICDLRLMIDPLTGLSRGYAFLIFPTESLAHLAVEKLNSYEIRKNKHLKVNMSIPNVRLFIGNLCKEMTKDDILHEFNKHVSGLTNVILYYLPNQNRNRGFCFIEFESHKHASQAKRKLTLQRTRIWGSEIWVDWAEPLDEPDPEVMSKVKVLYVRNLALEMTEEQLAQYFQQFGTVERVKKIKDYAFVHFIDRESALEAIKQTNGRQIHEENLQLEVSLAKPPVDKKKKEENLRNRERRLMMNMMQAKLFCNEPTNSAAYSLPLATSPLLLSSNYIANNTSHTSMIPFVHCSPVISSVSINPSFVVQDPQKSSNIFGHGSTNHIAQSTMMMTTASAQPLVEPNYLTSATPTTTYHQQLPPTQSAVARVTLGASATAAVCSCCSHAVDPKQQSLSIIPSAPSSLSSSLHQQIYQHNHYHDHHHYHHHPVSGLLNSASASSGYQTAINSIGNKKIMVPIINTNQIITSINPNLNTFQEIDQTQQNNQFFNSRLADHSDVSTSEASNLNHSITGDNDDETNLASKLVAVSTSQSQTISEIENDRYEKNSNGDTVKLTHN